MTDLTAAELARLRRKLGDTNTPPAYSDAELQDLWTESGEVWNITVRDAIDELIASAAKFTNYTQGESREEKAEIFKNLLKLRSLWQSRVDTEGAGATPASFKFVGIKVNRVSKTYPDDGHNYRRQRRHADNIELDWNDSDE